MARHSYVIDPPQPITVEIRTDDGVILTVTGTLDAVPWSAGHLAQKLVVVDASIGMTVPGHESEPDR